MFDPSPNKECYRDRTGSKIYFTKNSRERENISYTCYLAVLKQPTLQSLYTRNDLIYLFTILNSFIGRHLRQFFIQSFNASISDLDMHDNVSEYFVLPKPFSDILNLILFIVLTNIGTPCL